ncbi:hypothetical protein GW932_04445 [archaeon]|nr:hypothetical protein [archaeon]
MTDLNILDLERIENGLRKFVGQFTNTRKYKLFENFVRCQVEVKNAYFNSLTLQDRKLFNFFKSSLSNFNLLEEKFIFFQYVLFENPVFAGEIEKKYSEILYGKKGDGIISTDLNYPYNEMKSFLPEEDLIIFFRANDYNSFLDGVAFLLFEKEKKPVELFFSYINKKNLDPRYVFELLKRQFHGLRFDEFISHFNYIYRVEDKKLIDKIKNISLEFFLELMDYESEFGGYFVKKVYSSEEKEKMIFQYWDDKNMLARYIITILKLSIAVDKNHEKPWISSILFFVKLLELKENVISEISLGRSDLINIFYNKMLERNREFSGYNEPLNKITLEVKQRNYEDYFNFSYVNYLLKGERFLFKKSKEEIIEIFKEYQNKNRVEINTGLGIINNLWGTINNEVLEDFKLEVAILISIFEIIRNKDLFSEELKKNNQELFKLKLVKGNSKKNISSILNWVIGYFGFNFKGIEYMYIIKMIEERIEKFYPKLKFIIDEFGENPKPRVSKKKVTKKK